MNQDDLARILARPGYAKVSESLATRLPTQKPKPEKRSQLLADPKRHEGSGAGVAVILTRCSTGRLDRDNLYSATKKIIDCLFKSGRIAGDSESEIELFVFQKKVRRKDSGLLIEIITL